MAKKSEQYWRTEVSAIEPSKVSVRGYDLEQLIGIPFSAATYLLIRGRLPSPAETRVVDALLTAILDYGLEKSGTLAARAVVSSNPSMQAGLAAAILGAGEHSVDPSNAAQFVLDQHRRWSESGLAMDEYAEQEVAELGRRRMRVPGFGHPVFRYEDPRGRRLQTIAAREGLWGEPAQLYVAIHRAFIRNPKVAHFPMNDVGVVAAIAIALGFTPQETTALAVIGTLPGIAAHVTEEIESGQVIRRIPAADVDYEVPERDLLEDACALGWTKDALNG